MSTNQVNVDSKLIKSTQDILSKIIKKPILTEKLLKRPPFKFLHDIIINVISSTGYMKDSFNSDDLNQSIQKDKEGKIDFLQKVIDIVGSTLGKPVDVKAAKIVAGLEPDKTNQFLQLLGKAAIVSTRGGKKDSPSTTVTKSTVKSVNGKTINRPGKKSTPSAVNSNQSGSIGSKGKKSSTNDGKTEQSIGKNTNQLNSRENSAIKEIKTPANSRPGSYRTRGLSDVNDDQDEKDQDDNHNENFDNELRDKINSAKSVVDSSNLITNQSSLITENDDDEMMKPEDNQSVNAPGETITSVDESSTDLPRKGLPQLMVRPPTGTTISHTPRSPRPSARPTTARAAPPKVVTKRELMDSPSIDQSRILSSSEPVENLITEKVRPGTSAGGRKSVLRGGNKSALGGGGGGGERSDQDEDEDEDAMFIVQEVKDDLASTIESSVLLQGHSIGVTEEDKSKGSLVKQLIETKVALEGNNQTDGQLNVTNGHLSNALASRDINKLRENIQRLTQLATPLGRILDYLQEDINSIVTELRGWVDEHSKNMIKLQEEKSSIDTHLEPFRIQLEHLDSDISRLYESISIRKAAILRNEEKIERIIKMVVEKSN